MARRPLVHLLAKLSALLLLVSPPCISSSTVLSYGSSFTPDNRSIVSSDGSFALGYFTPSNSSAFSSSYLGIWYHNIRIRRVVWVANWDAPIRFPPGNLTISPASTLVLSDSRGTILWSSAVTPPPSSSTTTGGRATKAVLKNTGNLVLSAGDDTVLWQSRDHPADTILPITKLWANRATRTAESIVAWSSQGDPSPGNFSFGKDPENPLQFVTWRGKKDGDKYWRSDVWEGTNYSGISMGKQMLFLTFTETGPWSNATVAFSDSSLVRNLRLSAEGRLELQVWNQSSEDWSLASSLPASPCEEYAYCGAFGFCDGSLDPPACRCLDGFQPKSKADWDAGLFRGGCVRKEPVGVDDGKDDFVRFERMKLPDHLVDLGDLDVDRCVEACRTNRSCIAYVHSVPNSHSRTCLIWVDDLIDMGRKSALLSQEQLYVRGQELYVRIASTRRGNMSKPKVIIVVTSVLGAAMFVALSCLVWKRRKHLREKYRNREGSNEVGEDLPGVGLDIPVEEGKLDLPLMDFDMLLVATNNFSDSHKIGQGGFGNVYKGTLPGGQEVAIKRLSKASGQGLEEFKNEVVLIAQLQHRNLVSLLGCCIKGVEKLLIYEYMPNKSLDFLLFGDLKKQMVLCWERRFIIIKGIARGLRYLHEDSRLRIIHRDLKASNVLLDGDVNPRISDFGMARIFGGSQNQANTVRVAGTYGYMSPEYAMEGIFSVKSDVYSFGVLLLEIIIGQRNAGFRYSDQHFSLLSYAWESWNNGTAMDIIDPSIGDSFSWPKVSRCIHIGLLCVQDRTKDRPTMSYVVFMLENSSPVQAIPKKPTFTPKTKHIESNHGRTTENGSVNSVTLTAVECR